MRAFAFAPVLFTVVAAAADPLDALVRERIGQSDEPACVAVALVEQETRFAFGCSADADAAAPGRDSIFEIGSITKAFTGLLLADMVVRGEVSLDDPASKYSRPGATLPARGGREITLRDLATQTSGLPRMPPIFRPADPANPYADFDADTLYAALAANELQSDIGTRYAYSNFGYMWLSDIVSRVGGGTYEDVLRRRVLEPLGMRDTAAALDEARRRRFVDGHDRERHVVPHWDNAPQLAGVGGLRSTIGDMA
ncbi:MAG TPA: serine hydrolase domain-containing protein, partial [Usitatibacter sp.]|nr:serine hydrolase domain-containing protein [Usitatibacter sp.]